MFSVAWGSLPVPRHGCSRFPAPLAAAGELRKAAESERGRFSSPCQVSFCTVAEPLLGSGLGFWHPLCIRSGVVVSLVVSWSIQVLLVRNSEEHSKYLNVYVISKIPVSIILFFQVSVVKVGVLCMLEACGSCWMKQVFSWRSFTSGKFCFACLEFPSALHWIHYSTSSVIICSVMFKGCCLLSAGGCVSVVGEAMLLISSFASFCQVLWDCFMKVYISVIYYYECPLCFGI